VIPRLAQLTYPEVASLATRDPIVLIPVGAVEAHGPHLPLETDTLISEELARRSGEVMLARGRVIAIAPAITFSVADYAAGFAGTLSLRPSTAVALVRDVGVALGRHGLGKLCLINSHLDPAHVATLEQARVELEREGVEVAFPDVLEPRWGRTLSEEYKRGACHAGSYETSLLLASADARPLVREAERARLRPRDINLARAMKEGKRSFEEAGADRAYFGDPASASEAEGETLYARLVDMVVTVVAERWP
jgi:creatinine amidohydrolase